MKPVYPWSAWRDEDASAATLADALPDNHVPAEKPLTLSPRLVELCFQTAGLWGAGREGTLGLPLRVGRVATAGAVDGGPLTARAVCRDDGSYDCLVIDAEGRVVVRLEGYDTVAFPAPIPDDVSEALHATYGD